MNTNIPVKIMRVGDFTELAKITLRSEPDYANELDALIKQAFVDRRTVYYIGKYEKETAQLLERKHFDKDRPDCVFDGVKKVTTKKAVLNDHFSVSYEGETYMQNDLNDMWMDNPTLYDFIYHISKYNETATQKINLKFTETFIKRIVG